MALPQSAPAQLLRSALRGSLELHLDGIDEPDARRAALNEAYERLAKHFRRASLHDGAVCLDEEQREQLLSQLRLAADDLCSSLESRTG